MSWLKAKSWPWWAAGGLIGLLNVAAFYTANYYLSASTTFSRLSAMILSVFSPEHVAQNAYFQKVKPVVDWQFMLVIGVVIGAFIASRLSGDFKVSTVPVLWESRFGKSSLKRWGYGLMGGALLGFGARLADGCTSGHGLSGGSQLAVSSWIALLGFFVGGIFTAKFLYDWRR